MSYSLKTVLGTLCLVGVCLSHATSYGQLIHREGFEGDASGYTLEDEAGYAEKPDVGAVGWEPGIWGLNTTGPQIGLQQSAPARRAAILWDHTPLADDFTSESLDVWVSLADWAVGSAKARKDARVGFYPSYALESVEIVKNKLVASGYTEANISEIPTVDDVDANSLDLLIHSSELASTTFSGLTVPLISFSAPDHDDAAIAGIGTVVTYSDPVVLDVPVEFRNHPALGGKGTDGVIEWTNAGVQLQGIGKPHNGGKSIALVDRPDIDEQSAAIFVIEQGQPLLGAFNPDPEGDHYIVGSALNKFGSASERILELKPVNVAGKTDVKMTVGLAATAADFESGDYLRIEADPDGSGPKETQILEEFWGTNATEPTCRAGLSNGDPAGVAGEICLPTEAFGDFTFNMPADSTNLVVRFALLSTWGNEIIGIDNIRIHSGSLGPNGDYNGNGSLDAGDLDLQATGIVNNDKAFDLTGDGKANYDDRVFWVKNLKKTWIGDANLDGEFNSGDFVTVFTIGKYETGQAAGWSDGDWNADKIFGSGDFVSAFQDGGYEKGPLPAVSAVPEPTGCLVLLLCVFAVRRRIV